MAILEKKQAYYTYAGGYQYKQPPTLDSSVLKAMREFGVDEHGDPLWRFLWAGVAVVRTHPDDQHPTIRGDRAATKVELGRVTPRYLHVRAKSPVWLCYQTDEGHTARVKREDQVPVGKLSWWEYEYVEFGKLRWFLERKLTPEQLIEAGVYAGREVPPQGDYFCLSDGPIETAEGLYYEPTMEDVERLREHLYDERHESHADLMRGRAERRAAAEEQQEADSLDEMAGIVDDEMRKPAPAGGKTFAPAKQPPVFTGDVIPV